MTANQFINDPGQTPRLPGQTSGAPGQQVQLSRPCKDGGEPPCAREYVTPRYVRDLLGPYQPLKRDQVQDLLEQYVATRELHRNKARVDEQLRACMEQLMRGKLPMPRQMSHLPVDPGAAERARQALLVRPQPPELLALPNAPGPETVGRYHLPASIKPEFLVRPAGPIEEMTERYREFLGQTAGLPGAALPPAVLEPDLAPFVVPTLTPEMREHIRGFFGQTAGEALTTAVPEPEPAPTAQHAMRWIDPQGVRHGGLPPGSLHAAALPWWPPRED